jgi:hypothetical protein
MILQDPKSKFPKPPFTCQEQRGDKRFNGKRTQSRATAACERILQPVDGALTASCAAKARL